MESLILFLALVAPKSENKYISEIERQTFLKEIPSGGLIGEHRIQETLISKEANTLRVESK